MKSINMVKDDADNRDKGSSIRNVVAKTDFLDNPPPLLIVQGTRVPETVGYPGSDPAVQVPVSKKY